MLSIAKIGSDIFAHFFTGCKTCCQPKVTALEVIAIHVHLGTTKIEIVVVNVFWNGPNLTYSILIFSIVKLFEYDVGMEQTSVPLVHLQMASLFNDRPEHLQ